MEFRNSVLLLLVSAVCLAGAAPQEGAVDGSADLLSEVSGHLDKAVGAVQRSGRFGLATLDALADTFRAWMRPVKRVFQETVEKKTVSEVASEARNATVQFATRVSETEAFQSAQEAFSPLRRMFVQVRDSVKDKTLAQLADDVQRQIQQLDQSVARFITSFSESEERLDATESDTDVEPELV